MDGISPSKLIARGRTAEVYAWEPGKVIKLFYPWVDRNAALYEQRLARTVLAAGIQTPAVGELIEHNGRVGLIYERVDSATLLEQLFRYPWRTAQYARQMAALHAALHTCPAPDLPPMHQRLGEKIYHASALPEALRRKALEALIKLPQGHVVCHGDFHPANILVTSRGLMVIDWIDATAGHPLGDVARSQLLILHSALPFPLFPRLMLEGLRRWFFRAYLRHYFSLAPGSVEQLRQWLPVVAAARLSEGIRQDEQRLLRLVRVGLSDERG